MSRVRTTLRIFAKEISRLGEQFDAENHAVPVEDQYGLSWQIIPDALGELLSDPDPERAGRAMAAMMQMSKIDIEALKRAHDGSD